MNILNPFGINARGTWLGRVFDPTGSEMAYNTAERLASQSYNTAERLASQEFNTAERLATQEFNSAEAQKNRDWQEYLSNTSYQRAVADLKKAGVNPYAFLSSGASTPAGAVASTGFAHSQPARSTPAHVSGGATSKTVLGLMSLVSNTALGLASLSQKVVPVRNPIGFGR